MDKDKLFQSLYQSHVKAYPIQKRKESQKEVVQLWNTIKNQDNLEDKVSSLVKKNEALALQKKGTLMTFWSKQPSIKDIKPCELPPNSVKGSAIKLEVVNKVPNDDKQHEQQVQKAKVQEELKLQLDVINSDLVGYYKRKSSGMLTEQQETDLKESERKKSKLEGELKKKINDQNRQKKCREEKKKRLAALCETHPEVKEALNIREKCGRPRIEVDQPEILKAIVDIAIHGSAAHENRQSDMYRSIKTLNELTEQLKMDGFQISRSGVYLRLIPKRSSTLEGKRHIMTAPVRLIRAQNNLHSKHIDGRFCTATIRHLEELSSILGPNEVCFLSQDDKARVPIGLTAANKQAPLVMHIEYRVTLPDHDWVIAAKHKLIPSVYAGIQIQNNGLGKPESVGYLGPTYIAIRSGKHSSSTAYSHGLDLERLLEKPEFDSITKFQNTVKPVVVFIVDGGPDENPRYQKVISVGVHHFLKHNLDALFIACNAPGRSAFNRVERRMAPLSNELSGLILPHEAFGSHLDCQGRTVDVDLEKRNFEFAGNCLAEVWSSVMVDTFPTVAEYITPEKSELSPEILLTKSLKNEWFSKHVRTSQYFTQIVKCNDSNCCYKVRSSYFNVISTRFLPPPIPISQTEDGLKAPMNRSDGEQFKFPCLFAAQALKVDDILPRSTGNFKVLPYDLYCPSIQSILISRICTFCGLYFASNVMLKRHVDEEHKTVQKSQPENIKRIRPIRVAARRQRELMAVIALAENTEFAEWMDEDEVDLNGIKIPCDDKDDNMPVYSMDEHFSSPWEQDNEAT